MALNALRTLYGQVLSLGRWLRSFWLPRVVRHGALRIVPDRLIGPELALWQQQLIDTIQALPVETMPSESLIVHTASYRAEVGLRSRRVRFQPEHTLVKPGGSDSTHAPGTNTPIPGTNQSYLFRLLHQDQLARADLILDYSACNLEHWRASGHQPDLWSRARLFAPLALPLRHDRHPRTRDMVTSFSNPNMGRRAAFLAEARAHGLPVQNASGAYRRQPLMDLLDDTHILINLRQSEHHDTFEELRVLPALARGVLVLSEDVPLRETIPYHDCVVWASRADMVAVLAHLHSARDLYWHDIFGSGRCESRLQALQVENCRVLATFLASS